ncbi:MAG: sulfatase [Phycisphaerales bacterium]|nr:sulfatase [Phycisphaerales bacterium]
MLAPILTLCLLATSQPNIVIVMVDDLGWQDVSVPMHESRTPLNDQWHTPALEGLASQGTVLTNGYAAAPVCTPTRVSLMTGQMPCRHNITYWTLHHDRDTSRNHPRIKAPDWAKEGLQPDTPTLAALLKDAGYRTIHCGKAHFGAHGTPGSDPMTLGFDVNIAGHGSGGPASFYGTHNFSAAGRKRANNPNADPGGKSVWDIPGLEKYHGQDIYLTEALCNEAIEALDQAVAEDKPVFLHFAPYAVHVPIMANRPLLGRYDGLQPKEAAYATMIESVDQALGRILERLDHHGLADNTIVVFTSDNGGLSAHARGGEPHTHNAPLKSGKGSSYEGGTRVPWVIRWPGVTEAGARIDTPVITQDLAPTLARAAGTAFPPTHPIDGVDLRSVLESEANPDRPLVWHQPHQWGASGPGIEPFTAIRVGRWKLLLYHDGPSVELYDLSEDISEAHNVAQDHPEQVELLLEHLRRVAAGTGLQMSIDKATGAPVAISNPAQSTEP